MIYCSLLLANLLFVGCQASNWNIFQTTESPEEWTGRWFPGPPSTPKPTTGDLGEEISRSMGISDLCDNGQTNLEKDFNGDYTQYLCISMRNRLSPSPRVEPLLEYENVPALYEAEHKCMNESISYNSDVPTFGAHRQLWPVYGEYKYLPPQRWLHSVEHGGIVGLYHPCANPGQIRLFKSVIKDCLWRHVISPSNALPLNRPFAVVAWGVRLRLSQVDEQLIRSFIRNNALKGPERVTKDGQFSKNLVSPASMVSDTDDTQLCPEA